MFRSAGFIRDPNQQDPLTSAFTILGTILGNNARKREDAGLFDALSKFNPDVQQNGGTTTDYQDLAPKQADVVTNSTGLLGNPAQMASQAMDGYNPTPQTGLLAGLTLPQTPNYTQPTAPTASSPDYKFTTGIDQYSRENNPMKEVTTVKPMTIPDKIALAGQLRPQMWQAAKELAAKGYKPSEFLPYLQQTVNDKIASTYDQQRRDYASNIIGKWNTQDGLDAKSVYRDALQLKMLGYEIDPKTAWEVYKNPNLSFHDAGDRIVGLDPNSGEEKSTTAKGISPTAVYNKNTVGADTVYRTENRPTSGGNGGGGRPNGGTVKQVAPEKLEKYSDRYEEIMGDIWDSKSPAERASKVTKYATELNALGQSLDRDVQNDVDYITKTNPLGQ